MKGRLGADDQRRPASQVHLMLRKTDTIVEKMLTNWLALTMYEHFHGPVGQSLYVLFEALRCQLERGPVDCVSGDAYYSLNEAKLLREPSVSFEVVNLYVIVDTDILCQAQPSAARDLLMDNNNSHQQVLGQTFSDAQQQQQAMTNQNYLSMMNTSQQQQYATGNTITLAVHVLDCDTISQVKGKILSALYRNSAHSNRLAVDDVELSLRQQPQVPTGGHQTLTGGGGGGGQLVQVQQQQSSTVSLHDDDLTSVSSFNGMRKVNTLRHYGVTDQAIMMLNRRRRAANLAPTGTATGGRQPRGSTNLTEMLDEHYNNPYAEIQYGPLRQQQLQQLRQPTRAWHLSNKSDERPGLVSMADSSSGSSPSYCHSPSMMLLGANESHLMQHQHQLQQQPHFYHPSSGASSTSSTGNVMDTNSTSANSSTLMNGANLLSTNRPPNHHQNQQQPIYCQIGSNQGGGDSSYYCQIGNQQQQPMMNQPQQQRHAQTQRQPAMEREQEIYLARMLTSKGTVQQYIDDFLKTILTVKRENNQQQQQQQQQIYEDVNFDSVIGGGANSTPSSSGACPPAVKWLFDLLDEAAELNGISDQNVVHSWKSNAFLLRFWVNFIKNPNYILDVEKSAALDGCLSVVAQTLMDSCSATNNNNKDSTYNKLLFAKDVPRYRDLVRHFYEDIAHVRPVSDQEVVKQMASLSHQFNLSAKYDTNLALKELCVYAVNYGVEIMNSLNNDLVCQQLDLSQQLEQCFRSFTIFEACQ